MTDQRELDRLLDAFFIEGTDELADRVIDSALDQIDHTQQRRALRMPRRLSTMNPFTRVAAAAVIGVLAVGVAFYLIRPGQPSVGTPSPAASSSSSPNPAAAVIPSPSLPLPTPSSSSTPCVTFKVSTGDALPKFDGEPRAGIGPGRGVFLSGSTLVAVGPGTGPARPIAQVTEASGDIVVLELSPDGSTVLIRAGYSDHKPAPRCADLFVVRTDGSGATRLTTVEAGWVVTAAAFSPDGTHVAYSWSDLSAVPDLGSISLLDLASGRTVDQPCNGRSHTLAPGQVDWSPAGDRVAVACDQTLTIFDPNGTTAPTKLQTTNDIVAFGWTDDNHLAVAGADGRISSIDVVSQTSTYLGRFDDPEIEIVVPSGVFSPDGRWLVYAGGERGDVPGNDFREVNYLVPATGGTPTRIAEIGGQIAWSGDSRALVYVTESPQGTQILARMDVETLQRSTIGTVASNHPDGVSVGQGVWQIP
jgi:Tol biopolymer transport system component